MTSSSLVAARRFSTAESYDATVAYRTRDGFTGGLDGLFFRKVSAASMMSSARVVDMRTCLLQLPTKERRVVPVAN
jgi:hypothetical protein